MFELIDSAPAAILNAYNILINKKSDLLSSFIVKKMTKERLFLEDYIRKNNNRLREHH